MNRFILNSAVITNTGDYSYKKLNKPEALEWLSKGSFYATIGYQETVDAFELMFGIKLKMNRRQISMAPGDEALVFRLTKRLDNPEIKGKMSIDYVKNNLEIGLLSMHHTGVEDSLCEAECLSKTIKKDLGEIKEIVEKMKGELQ